MTTVKLDRTTLASIRQHVEAKSGVRRPRIEVGLRWPRDEARDSGLNRPTANALLWESDGDLYDLVVLRELDGIELHNGWACLDCYVYDTEELRTNVSVYLQRGDAWHVAATFESGEYVKERKYQRDHAWKMD